jgi:MoaA/NifB/PqqE/SkfB family radical SAM enzyme
MEGVVIKTKKGFFIRNDEDFGALVFSPYSGLFFAIAKDYVEDTLNFCNKKKNNLLEEIQKQLNIGLEATENHFETQSWLPNKESFSYRDGFPDRNPIVINWLISNKCFFKCNYCYASDVIGQEFDMKDAKGIANDILKTQPLAVVLSGGEPLREKEKMIDALNILGDKVGIIIDTNGYNYDEELANLFKKYNVVVRVSLDTLNNELGKKIRPLENQKQDNNVLDNIIGNILAYKKKKIPILIHTVVSTVNKNSLDDLYDNLPRLGLNGWRLFSLITPNDKERKEQFDKMMSFGKAKNTKEAKDDINHKFKKIYKKTYVSKSNFSVQVVPTSESAKNAVILVLPDGKFVTESMFRNEKTEINKKNIFGRNIVSLQGHYERYLGKI